MWEALRQPEAVAATLGLMALHIGLSLAASVHALLHKRDIASAIGWIGLAWLSPFLGAALYFLLGINRVRRRAEALGRPGDAPPPAPVEATAAPAGTPLEALDRTALRLSGRPLVAGNAVTLLRNGDAAYPRMLAAIEGAERRVVLSSYILRDDLAGRPILDALIRAHERGVAVRVLVDGIGGGYLRAPAWRRLRRHGVPAARFLHVALPWTMPFLNLRSHKKLLVVDEKIGFAGGLNIGAENLVLLAPPHPVHDTHFELRGPILGQLAAVFDADWAFCTGAPAPAEAVPPAVADGAARLRVITSGPDRDLQKIETLLLQAVTCARRSVLVMTPYFLPEDRLVSALALAALRGVEVDILVPERSNHRFVDWAMHAHVGPLVEAGCRIRLGAAPFDHSKLMVVDEGWALVGSSNWDMRSLRLNFELDLEIQDGATAAEIARMIRARPYRLLTEAALAQRSMAVRLRDAAFRLALPYV